MFSTDDRGNSVKTGEECGHELKSEIQYYKWSARYGGCA